MSKVVDFNGRNKTPKNTAVPEVVTLLEQLLEEAKQGRILGIGTAVVRPGMITEAGWANGKDPIWPSFIAGVAVLQRSMLDQYMGGSPPPEEVS